MALPRILRDSGAVKPVGVGDEQTRATGSFVQLQCRRGPLSLFFPSKWSSLNKRAYALSVHAHRCSLWSSLVIGALCSLKPPGRLN